VPEFGGGHGKKKYTLTLCNVRTEIKILKIMTVPPHMALKNKIYVPVEGLSSSRWCAHDIYTFCVESMNLLFSFLRNALRFFCFARSRTLRSSKSGTRLVLSSLDVAGCPSPLTSLLSTVIGEVWKPRPFVSQGGYYIVLKL